jgi:hypothetical protein
MELPKKIYPKYKGRYCCVVGCFSAQGREDVRFSGFSKRDLTQALLWKQAIKREEDDGSEWIPKPKDKVCGKHFISGEPSNIQTNPDYVPSIFPTNHRRKFSETDMIRYQRVSSFFKTLQLQICQDPSESARSCDCQV